MQKRINLIILLLLSLGYLQAQEMYQLRNAEISISGTSSLHDWTSRTSELTATADLTVENGNLVDIPSLKVTIPVLSIKSEKGKIMDNKTYKALQSDDHPAITFKLQELNSMETNSEGFDLTARGQLTIAGQTRTVELVAKATTDGNGGFQFSGSKALKMTDFGIDPPTALLGTLKTGDDITVAFEFSLIKGDTAN
jgi:polyisoprenoid-binding protein YceI